MKAIRCLFLLVLLSIASCSESGPTAPSLASDPEARTEALQEVIASSTNVQSLLDEVIATAANSGRSVDPADLARDLETLDQIRSATVSESGTVISIVNSNGLHSNLLVVRRDDERLFVEEQNAVEGFRSSGDAAESETFSFQGTTGARTFPSSSRAVILAPFQFEFRERLDIIERNMSAAGFEVDVFIDQEASLERFRGDFLRQYGLIYISTHSAADITTFSGEYTGTHLLTGTRLTTATAESLGSSEYWDVLSLGGISTGPWVSVGAPWLDMSGAEDFPSTWFFANSCESSTHTSGSRSLSAYLLSVGVEGYNGFSGIINNSIAIWAGRSLTAGLSAGRSLTEATAATRSDTGIRSRQFALRLLALGSERRERIDIDLLQARQRNSDVGVFWLDPDGVVGVPTLTPSGGPPGTPVQFELRVSATFADLVSAVEFDIDNTNERLSMTRVGSTLWFRDGLRAPNASEYPRIDTFTYTAFDSSGQALGSGSATFTIEPPGSASLQANLQAGLSGGSSKWGSYR